MRDAIWKHVTTPKQVFFSRFPCNLEVPLHIKRNKAELFLDIIDDEALIHHIHTPVAHQLLEVIGERLPAKIQSLHPVIEREVLKHGRSVRKAEAAVDDQAALRLGNEPVWPARRLVEVDERRRVGDEEGSEIEVLEDDLVDGALDGGEGEEGLGQEEGGAGRVDFEEVREEVGPQRRLEIGIDKVAAVEGAAEGGGGEVFRWGEELVGDQPFLRGRGAGGAVRDHASGVALAADAGFYEAAAVVHHHHVRHYVTATVRRNW